MKQSILRALFALVAVAAFASPSFATSINFLSSGTFSNVSCTADCGTSSGNTELDFGAYFFGLLGKSTLTANPLSFSGNTNATGVHLAELTWNNQTTDTSNSSHNPDVTAKWNFGVTFTNPSSASDTGIYSLAIDQTNNPNISDTITFTLVDPLGFSIPGITITNLHLVAGSGPGSVNGNVWTNPENGTSQLFLVADISNVQAGQQSAVPEPGSMILLGTGLLGLASGARRRFKK